MASQRTWLGDAFRDLIKGLLPKDFDIVAGVSQNKSEKFLKILELLEEDLN